MWHRWYSKRQTHWWVTQQHILGPAWICGKCAVNHEAAHGVVYFNDWTVIDVEEACCCTLHPWLQIPLMFLQEVSNKYICEMKTKEITLFMCNICRESEKDRYSIIYCAFVFDAGGKEKLHSSCRISAGILLFEKGLSFCLKSTFSQGPLAFSNITKLLIYCVG